MSRAEDPGREEDPVPADDAVIGRVFRWSILAAAVLAVPVALTLWLTGREQPPPPIEEAELVPPRPQQRAADPPVVRFSDVTLEAGIDFVHENAARGAKLMPETMGSGAAFLDYDRDGDPDLLLINAVHWPGDAPRERASGTLALYRNDGSGHFEDVTRETGLDIRLYGVGVAVADYDGDGDLDVYITAIGPNRLLRNDGGRFVDVSRASGTSGDPASWSTSAGFFDADGDGDLDLFVCNYIEWSPEIDREVDFRLTGIGRAYGPPMGFTGSQPVLLRNDGGGRFVDISESAGLRIRSSGGEPVGKALALAFADLDGDGRLDVLVANDTVRNFFFRNLGAGRFEERGIAAGLAFDANGAATGAMGIDVAHYRNDDTLGIAIGNFANEMTSLYVGRGSDPVFSDEAIVDGIGPTSRAMLTFGLFFFDYDLDGRSDLFQANGHLEERIAVLQASQHYRQPSQLFWNAGPAFPQAFTPVEPATTGDLARPLVGRGATYADIDADGDLDLLVTQPGDRPVLFRNDQALGHHWLRVELAGSAPNPDAIGAVVEVETQGRSQRRLLSPTRSYLSQVELPLTFGLGSAQSIDRITVRWPDGGTSELSDVAVDRKLVIRR